MIINGVLLVNLRTKNTCVIEGETIKVKLKKSGFSNVISDIFINVGTYDLFIQSLRFFLRNKNYKSYFLFY